MKTRLIFFLVFGVFAFLPAHSHAQGSCGAGARKLASREKATIIAVQPKTNASGKQVCEVRLKKNSKDGQPPRIIIKQFNPK